MNFFKCKNATLYMGNETKCIKCKKTGEVCAFQRYCSQKRNYELTESSQVCILNPKNCESDTATPEVKKGIVENIVVEKKPIIVENTTEEKLDSVVVRKPHDEEVPAALAIKEEIWDEEPEEIDEVEADEK